MRRSLFRGAVMRSQYTAPPSLFIAGAWEALRPGLPITAYGDIVSDGVLNAINIRIR
jgi:hypothetical protein